MPYIILSTTFADAFFANGVDIRMKKKNWNA